MGVILTLHPGPACSQRHVATSKEAEQIASGWAGAGWTADLRDVQ